MTLWLATPLMFFVNPLLLWGGIALASVPIIIHLLNRRRVRNVPWAAMDWLLAALKRHQRRLRIENWLILLLRCAAIILLGLALARPVLTDSALAGLFGQKRSIYIVLDTSYSTSSKDAARTVFERVKHEAGKVLESLGKEDSVTVVVTNDPDEDNADGVRPGVLVSRTVGTEGRTRAKERVATLRPRHAGARWSDALAAVKDQMQPEDVNRHLIVITDLQAHDWLAQARAGIAPEGADKPAPGGAAPPLVGSHRVRDQLRELLRQSTHVQIINVGGVKRRNLTVSALHAHADRGAFVGRPLSLEIEVSNHGVKPVEGAVVEVFVDDTRGPTRTLPLLPGASVGARIAQPGKNTIRIALSRTTFETPGTHEIRVRVGPPSSDPEADALALDSERFLAVSVRRRIQVVALAADSRTPRGAGPGLSALDFLAGIYAGDRPDRTSDVTALNSLYSFDKIGLEPQLLQRLRQRDRSPVDLVVICNRVIVDPQLAAALREYVREGGGLLFFTGDRFAGRHEMFNEAFHPDTAEEQLCPFALGPVETRQPGETSYHFDLDPEDDVHPLAIPFTGRDADLWIKRNPPQIRGRTAFVEPVPTPHPDGAGGSTDAPPPAARPGHIVLRFRKQGQFEKTGAPAIVAGTYGEGRTLWVGTSIDPGWLENAAFPFLPVFLEVSALWLTQPDDGERNLLVGDIIERRLPPGAAEPRFSIPGGTQVGPTRRVDDPKTGSSVVSYDTVGVVGTWKLTYGISEADGTVRKVVDLTAVNPDPQEGGLAPADPRDIRGDIPPERDLTFHTSYGDTAQEIQEVREGEITRTLLWILLALLILESFLAWRFGRRRGAAAPTGGDA